MKRLAIFDLDGTLLDSIGDLAATCNHALQCYHLPTHPVDQYKTFVGDGVYRLIERMTPERKRSDAALLAGLKVEFDRYYEAHGEDLTQPYPDIIELLKTLHNRGIKTAVLSNKPHIFAVPLCERYFGDLLDVAYGQREGYPRKPDGSLIHELLAQFGVQPQECVYCGDSDVDMQTGRNAGVFSVGVTWGFRSEQELRENGADQIVHTPLELLQFF